MEASSSPVIVHLVMSKRVRDESGRRSWNVDAYSAEQSSLPPDDSHECHEEDKSGKRPKGIVGLEARSGCVSLDQKMERRVGKFVQVLDEKDNRAGFFCEKCKYLTKDSKKWLDHINSKQHVRNLGMALRAVRSTVEDVKERMKMFEEQKTSSKKLHEDLDKDILVKKSKLEKKSKSAEIQDTDKASNSEEILDPELLAMQEMGLPISFGSKRK